MRTSVSCTACSYRFHLPISNLRFVEACPACEAPRKSLRWPAALPPMSTSSGRLRAIADKPATRPIRMPKPRLWRSV